MKLVVDSNILFSFFWRDTFTKRLIIKGDFELIAPEFALKEIKKYKDVIIGKAKISEEEFNVSREKLLLYVDFFHSSSYRDKIVSATDVCPDEDDIDYFALALKMKLVLCMNDKRLKDQKEIEVFNTFEVMGFVK